MCQLEVMMSYIRDADNSWKLGKLPAVNAIFPAVKHYFFLQFFFMLSDDCYLFILFVYTFIAVLPELKGLQTRHLV